MTKKSRDKSIVGASGRGSISEEEALENDLHLIGAENDEDLEGLRVQTGLTEDDFERLLGRPYRSNRSHMRQMIPTEIMKPVIKRESPLADENERGCSSFVPHAFETALSDIPTIFIAEQALKDMMILVGEAKTEVGWLGTVTRVGRDFLIEEIFIPQQEVSFGTTEMTIDGMAQLTRELIKREDADEVCNNLKFWGHSHVNMAVEPSGTDDDQMDKFSYNDFFIRAILNKKGEMKMWLYIYEYGMMIEDVPWMVHVDPSEERAKELRTLLEKNAIYNHAYYPDKGSFGSGSFGMGNFGKRDNDDFHLSDLANL